MTDAATAIEVERLVNLHEFFTVRLVTNRGTEVFCTVVRTAEKGSKCVTSVRFDRYPKGKKSRAKYTFDIQDAALRAVL